MMVTGAVETIQSPEEGRAEPDEVGAGFGEPESCSRSPGELREVRGASGVRWGKARAGRRAGTEVRHGISSTLQTQGGGLLGQWGSAAAEGGCV